MVPEIARFDENKGNLVENIYQKKQENPVCLAKNYLKSSNMKNVVLKHGGLEKLPLIKQLWEKLNQFHDKELVTLKALDRDSNLKVNRLEQKATSALEEYF